ncbi:GntT/GntP/DsdX family permease [Streptomyces sp. NPDC001178]
MRRWLLTEVNVSTPSVRTVWVTAAPSTGCVALVRGMPLGKISYGAVQCIGGQVGDTMLTIGLGAMVGRAMGDCGAAQRIATRLLDRCGPCPLRAGSVIHPEAICRPAGSVRPRRVLIVAPWFTPQRGPKAFPGPRCTVRPQPLGISRAACSPGSPRCTSPIRW